MKPRATKDLGQLPDPAFFEQVSQGMAAVLRNASALIEDARLLAESGRGRARDVVLAIAEEESAKYHILLDAVRTPRQGPEFGRQLGRFNHHLAKGIYAEYMDIRPADYAEVLRWLEMIRKEFYLDDPNDVDWIFRNQIIQGREEAFYVDYVETDEGHLWLEPRPLPDFFRFNPPTVFTLAAMMSEAGMDSPAALATIAAKWRGVVFQPTDHWQVCRDLNWETLQALNSGGMITEAGAAHAGEIASRWHFPLWNADLDMIEVSKQDLRAVQAAWTP